jgi:hypothetical protein
MKRFLILIALLMASATVAQAQLLAERDSVWFTSRDTTKSFSVGTYPFELSLSWLSSGADTLKLQRRVATRTGYRWETALFYDLQRAANDSVLFRSDSGRVIFVYPLAYSGGTFRWKHSTRRANTGVRTGVTR